MVWKLEANVGSGGTGEGRAEDQDLYDTSGESNHGRCSYPAQSPSVPSFSCFTWLQRFGLTGAPEPQPGLLTTGEK